MSSPLAINSECTYCNIKLKHVSLKRHLSFCKKSPYHPQHAFVPGTAAADAKKVEISFYAAPSEEEPAPTFTTTPPVQGRSSCAGWSEMEEELGTGECRGFTSPATINALENNGLDNEVELRLLMFIRKHGLSHEAANDFIRLIKACSIFDGWPASK